MAVHDPTHAAEGCNALARHQDHEEEAFRRTMDELEERARERAQSAEEAARLDAIYKDGDADFEEILRLSRFEKGPWARRRSAELFEIYENYTGNEYDDHSFIPVHDEEHWPHWQSKKDLIF